MSAEQDWMLIAERATLLSDDIRERLGGVVVSRGPLTPDAQMYASAVATLLSAFARHIAIDLVSQKGDQKRASD